MFEFAEASAKYGPYLAIAVLSYVCRWLMLRSDKKDISHAKAIEDANTKLAASQEARIKENNENGQLLATTNEALRFTHSLVEKANAATAAMDLRLQLLLKKEAS